MKTPREILLNRHQAAQTELDRIRQTVVAEMPQPAPNAEKRSSPRELPLLLAAALKLWRELILPCRRTWAGLAAVWLVIVGFHIGGADSSGAAARTPVVPGQELRIALAQRRAWLAELAQFPRAETVERAKPDRQPRSERRATSVYA
jgi:hypothetical protein